MDWLKNKVSSNNKSKGLKIKLRKQMHQVQLQKIKRNKSLKQIRSNQVKLELYFKVFSLKNSQLKSKKLYHKLKHRTQEKRLNIEKERIRTKRDYLKNIKILNKMMGPKLVISVLENNQSFLLKMMIK